MNVFYLKDKECKLIDRSDRENPSDFTIHSPNGSGIHDIDFEEIYDTKYVDGEGVLRKSFTRYRIVMRFIYSSHVMDLTKIFDTDEIQIPLYPFFEDQDETQTYVNFVFINDRINGEYFLGQYQLGASEIESIYSGETLDFRSVETFSRNEIIDIFNIVDRDPEYIRVNVLHNTEQVTYFGEEVIFNPNVVFNERQVYYNGDIVTI